MSVHTEIMNELEPAGTSCNYLERAGTSLREVERVGINLEQAIAKLNKLERYDASKDLRLKELWKLVAVEVICAHASENLRLAESFTNTLSLYRYGILSEQHLLDIYQWHPLNFYLIN